MRLAFESINSAKQTASPMWVGIIQSLEDLNRTKWRKEEFNPILLPHILSHLPSILRLQFIPLAPLVLSLQTQTELQHRLSWVSHLQMADPETSKPPISSSEPIPDNKSPFVHIVLCVCIWMYMSGSVKIYIYIWFYITLILFLQRI